MQNINEFLKDVRHRITNPLFVSFIISWLIINWRIVVAFTMNTTAELKTDKYSSYIDVIVKNNNINNLLWLPLASAFGYALLYPLIKNLNAAFAIWMQTWGERWQLKISKTATVTIDKYIQLNQKYKERENLLSDVIKSESLQIDRNTELQHRINDLEAELARKDKDIQTWRHLNDASHLNGEYRMTYKSDAGIITSFVEITNSEIYKKLDSGQKESIFKIINSTYNFVQNSYAWHLEDQRLPSHPIYPVNLYRKSANTFTGTGTNPPIQEIFRLNE